MHTTKFELLKDEQRTRAGQYKIALVDGNNSEQKLILGSTDYEGVAETVVALANWFTRIGHEYPILGEDHVSQKVKGLIKRSRKSAEMIINLESESLQAARAKIDRERALAEFREANKSGGKLLTKLPATKTNSLKVDGILSSKGG